MTMQWELYKGHSEEWNEFVFKNEAQYRQLFEWGEVSREI